MQFFDLSDTVLRFKLSVKKRYVLVLLSYNFKIVILSGTDEDG